MGDICQLSCECGYAIDLYVGVGLASSKLNTLRRVFSEEKRKDSQMQQRITRRVNRSLGLKGV